MKTDTRSVASEARILYAGEPTPPELFAVVEPSGGRVLARGLHQMEAKGFAARWRKGAIVVREAIQFLSDSQIQAAASSVEIAALRPSPDDGGDHVPADYPGASAGPIACGLDSLPHLNHTG